MMRRLLVLLPFAFAATAFGQAFTVTSSTPAPGDSSVALQTAVRFTFGAPLDTSARFGGDLPVAFFPPPAAGAVRVESVRYSDDLTQLSLDVTHTDDADFVWILTGARSTGGGALCPPYPLSYTTADTHGTAKVGGLVLVYVLTKRGSCAYTLVPALLDRPPGPEARVVAATQVDPADLTYVLPHVRPGTYWPVVFPDLDGDGVLEPTWAPLPADGNEMIAWDPDHDLRPDSIVVTDGAALDVSFRVVAGAAEPAEAPGTARLETAYPNPFNPSTTIRFHLERPVRVRLAAYDLLGRCVAVLAEGLRPPGDHAATWDAHGLPGSVYAVRLEGDAFTLASTAVLAK